MTIVLTGASGFVGKKLVRDLSAAGHDLRILGRHRGSLPAAVRFATWDGIAGEPPMESLDGADAVIHLAGEPVAQRWTPEAKRRIAESRSKGTRNLVSALARMPRPPEVLVSASAVGYYGAREEEELTESSAPGAGFLPDVCIDWEAAAGRASDAGIRVVELRTGIVLGADGGALKQMLPPFRMGVGGPLGSGRQWMAWIHIDDLVRLIAFAVENRGASGALNAVAPEPVRNADFTRALGRVLHRPAFMPGPAFALKLLYGEMAGMLLGSQRVMPEKTLASGFHYQHPSLEEALRNVLG
jgi:uncharacterized protein (TIGR01777 family)